MNYGRLREGMCNGFLAGTVGASIGVSGAVILVPLWLRSKVAQ